MSSRLTTYRALLGVALIGGAIAVGFSLVGLYTVFTNGTATDNGGTEIPGEYACTEFDGDPAVAHGTDYEIERTLVGGSALKTFNATATADGFRVEVVTAGRLLEASARRADGTNHSVRIVEGENRIVLEQPAETPFRLWIDTIEDGSSITRTRLEICP